MCWHLFVLFYFFISENIRRLGNMPKKLLLCCVNLSGKCWNIGLENSSDKWFRKSLLKLTILMRDNLWDIFFMTFLHLYKHLLSVIDQSVNWTRLSFTDMFTIHSKQRFLFSLFFHICSVGKLLRNNEIRTYYFSS